MVACLIFWELLKPFTGEAISWAALWKLLGLGLVAAILVFLAAKNDYRKTYIASYKEASTTRLRIAEHLRKLPMSFFNTKDLSDITTNMMADCSSMESMLSSTIPPLIANIISVTLTCVCLAFFDWRMALAIFCTMPVTFLIILCGRKLQLRLFDKQVDVKLEASSQIQEYLEGIKIIKSCGLGGSRFDALDKALQAMRKIAIKVELASGILVQGASLILQAGLGITIFIGTVLITNGKIELLSLLVLLMFSTQIYGPILAILSQLTSLFHLGTVTNRMRTLLTTPTMEGVDKDVSKYDIIYAGAQKNLAPAGVTLAIVRVDALGHVERPIPTMLNYKTHVDKDSMFNTPPVLPIYAALQTLKWYKEQGGVAAMEKKDMENAAILYDEIDRNKLFRGTVAAEDRSIMNVCFVMNDEYKELEDEFSKFAAAAGMVGIKGHRSVGGFRASLYNAMPKSSVEALVACMKDFEKQH